MERCLSQAMDDGFESGQEENISLFKGLKDEKNEHTIQVTEQMIKYIPPPQEIKEKPYSLHPDMLTGWAPKVPLPKPVPLIFPHDPLSEVLNAYFKTKHNQVALVYLGPRFDNTFSAWKVYGVQFPYNHLGSQKVVTTDRRFQGMNPGYPKEEVRFESMFESGNLDAVFKVDENQFDCYMRVDANTRGHLHWYYFKMLNLKRNEVYTINILNFKKMKSLYTRGMKPYFYSYKREQNQKTGWIQDGTDIEYDRKKSKLAHHLFRQQDTLDDQNSLTLSFKIYSEYQDDTLEVAYCPPYTFSHLNGYLKNMFSLVKERDIIHQQSLGTSLGGFKIPLLTITNDSKQTESEFKDGKIYKSKGLIFVMGRIHPGQSNGSHMMEGFLNWLCGCTQQAEELRRKYMFKVVPMLNPDGVVIGNYRTGLSGRDFNREFIDPDPSLFVEITQLKNYLHRCKLIYQKEFTFFLDFHGHSVKKNSFAYGPEFLLSHSKYYQSRLFPKLLSKRTTLFRYYSCIFKVVPCKISTARAAVLRQYGIPFAYTIEASNGSYYDYEQKVNKPFTAQKWKQIGGSICESLYDYWLIFKQIQESRLRRKKERQGKLKSKGTVTRRIQSSSFRSTKTTGFGRTSKINYRSEKSIGDVKKDNLLGDILNELCTEMKEDERCSDDDVSQGKSDSQNSEDDIDLNSMKAMLGGRKEGYCKMRKAKTKQQPKKEPQRYARNKIERHSSFLTDFHEQSPEPEPTRRHPLIQRKKRLHFIQKKLCSMNVGLSPPQQKGQDLNGTAKIININFIMNPVPMINLSNNERRSKMRTQVNEQPQIKPIKAQIQQCTRRTFFSLQKDLTKKQMLKRMSVQSSQNEATHNFRNNEVIGRRIFTEI